MKVISKNSWLLLSVGVITLALNWQCIAFDMMYLEQPLLYNANQQIHSFSDLLRIYSHPYLFDIAVPFFRPSGHFLIYQLLTPWLGWHNTRALLIVNFLFLSFAGFFLIKLYQLLFPRFRFGGYLAFAFYLMQPATMLGRATVMHFEFAYVCFGLMAWYYFAKFCAQNKLSNVTDIATIKLHSLRDLIFSLTAYVLAVTFKEPALMLAPILIAYFFIVLDREQAFPQYLKTLWQSKECRQLLLILSLVFMMLSGYMTLAWPQLHNPMRGHLPTKDMLNAINAFLKLLCCTQNNVLPLPGLHQAKNYLTYVAIPGIARVLLRTLFLVTLCHLVWLFRRSNLYQDEKKRLVYLFFASVVFMALPVAWGAAMPWHLSLMLLCLSLIVGFNLEVLITTRIKNPRVAACVLSILGSMIALTTLSVNYANIKYYAKPEVGFAFLLDRNAIYHAPVLPLNAESVLVVEDSQSVGDYALGDSAYPLYLILDDNKAFKRFTEMEHVLFFKTQPVYNGNLFRWAYLQPNLKEEVYPFNIAHMEQVYDLVLHDWLQHIDNIFCVGYDAQGNWHDRTNAFKQNLLAEKVRRHLQIHSYQATAQTQMTGHLTHIIKLPYADPELCRANCDATANCRGFNFLKIHIQDVTVGKCLFYDKLASTAAQPSFISTAFVKA